MLLAIKEIRIEKRHRKDLGDIQSLAASIAEVGLLHPVVVRPDRTLVSGERRLKAMESLGWVESPVNIVEGLEETLKALKAEADENVCRKDFLPSEAVEMAEKIYETEKKDAKDRQRQTTGRPSLTKRSGNFPDLNSSPKHKKRKSSDGKSGQVRDAVGAAVGMSGKTYEKAKVVKEAAKKEPEKYGKLLEDMDRTGKVDGVFKRLNNMQAAEEIRKEPPPLPDGQFRVIAIDPPWEYAKRADDPSHRASLPYPSMSIEDIKKLDVGGRAHEEGCVLWLWITNSHIPHAWEILEAWGFTYKTMLTWVKDRMGTGDWLRGQTEHCLMAIRGKPTILLTNQTTVLNGPLREHSQKPEQFYAMVEKLCPGSKLEMFSRQKREGWESHGNEC